MRSIDVLAAQLQHSPTVGEIAAYLKVTDEQVLEAMHAGAGYDSSPLVTADDGESAPTESPALATEDTELSRAELRESLGSGFAALSERDKEVLHMRFFEDLTQSEIAERIDVSQMQVSRILRASLKAIRETLDDPIDVDGS